MILSDISVKRPVFAAVLSLVLIAFGLVAFDRLPLREYPDINAPVISITTNYFGASASVVESRITEVIEERISGVRGIKFIQSSSTDGRSRITIEFEVGQDLDSAANDIRDRISGITNNLPVEADPPRVQKADSNDRPILWFVLTSEEMSVVELTDYVDRYLVERFSVLDGVSRIAIGGQQSYAMRIWLDRKAMAARGITASDVESALRRENVELPAGTIEGKNLQFTLRTERAFRTAKDFANLVVATPNSEGGYITRLGDIAKVEKGTVEKRTFFRGNQIPLVGVGIIKQSTANTIDVAQAAKDEAKRVQESLPNGMKFEQSFDRSIFIRSAISEVYNTLFFAIFLVVLVIFIFLGSVRAMLIPAVTVPVSITATFLILMLFGFSINLLTLLALVLTIGLVVDDSIVVLENISRRMNKYNEPPLLAAFHGARQVAFAVIATTVVLIAVFVPIAFQTGNVGRMFSEFALTMAGAVIFSSFIALTLSPMLASKILKPSKKSNSLARRVDQSIGMVQRGYRYLLDKNLAFPYYAVAGFFALMILGYFILKETPQEYAPKEDRGSFFIMVNGPEGATFSYMKEYMDEIERRLMPYVESGELTHLLVRAPRSFGRTQNFNTGMVIALLDDWDERRNVYNILPEIRRKMSDLPGVRAFPGAWQGLGSSGGRPVQFVIGGGTYKELTEWRDILEQKIGENNPGLQGIDWDYKETKPQMNIKINYERAAQLGVKVGDIGSTLETMLGSKRVTSYVDRGEEYDVIVEGERSMQRSTTNLQNIYVRSNTSDKLIPLSNIISVKEGAVSNSLNRYNRVRAITLSANLKEGYPLGESLDYLQELVREHLPSHAVIDYKGESRAYKNAGQSLLFIFLLGIFITYLALAAQFESWVHPAIIMLSVPLAIVGGLIGLLLTSGTLNLYSQIALVMLVGLAAKNGILIVEFANQLRDEGVDFEKAIRDAAEVRFRPILMTAITTAVGAVPLIFSSGAGAETREVIGIVVFAGITLSTLVTLFIIPVAYSLLARKTGSPNDTSHKLANQQEKLLLNSD